MTSVTLVLPPCEGVQCTQKRLHRPDFNTIIAPSVALSPLFTCTHVPFSNTVLKLQDSSPQSHICIALKDQLGGFSPCCTLSHFVQLTMRVGERK